MADTVIVAAPVNGKKKMSAGKKWLIAGIILIVIIAALIAWNIIQHKKSLKAMQDEIAKEALPYGDQSATVTQLLTDRCGEIISDRDTRKLARQNAKTLNISYEQAVVDMAIGYLRNAGYIE